MLRDRLTAQAAGLARRAEALNARRTEEFGSTRLELTSTERLRTEHTCVPRDIVSVGGTLLFGHNVFLGLKPERTVGDVFALYDRDLNRLPEDAVPGLLDDTAFVWEFATLYRYGKTTLMEYVADRLGLILVKVNGPALGRAVTSLDPAEAANATARQEVEKINFALAAGSIVFTRLRVDPRTQAHYERRTQEGKTRREIIRCLKRYAAREVFNLVRTASIDPPL